MDYWQPLALLLELQAAAQRRENIAGRSARVSHRNRLPTSVIARIPVVRGRARMPVPP